MLFDNGYPDGHAFEQIMFGVLHFSSSIHLPYYLDFDGSMQQVIKMAWRNHDLFLKGKLPTGKFSYNPLEPKGEIKELFEQVKRHLPRWIDGRVASPLNFYVSIGKYSLDRYHKVDGFFWWEGVYFTIDVTTRQKDLNHPKRADYLFMPDDLEDYNLHILGFQIADELESRRRRVVQRYKKRREFEEERKLWIDATAS